MARMMSWRSGLAMVALGATALACGGGGDGGNGPTPTIQVTATPASLTLVQGSSGTVTVNLVRGGGFTGAVTATVSGLPADITVTVSPTSLSGATTSAVVTLAAASTVAPGAYTATVTGTASGVGSATVTFSVTVTARPEVALAVAPAALTVQQGATGNAAVTITRTNFTGDVALTLTSPNANITGAFNPATTTGTTSALTISVAAAAAPGNYTLTVRSNPTGIGERTATLTVTVTTAAQLALTIAPTTLTVQQGAAGNATVTITRTNFTGDVALTLTSPNANITGAFNPATTAANTSALTVNVAAATAPGSYALTVKGTATAVGERTATLTVTVTAPPPSSIAIALAPPNLSVSQGGQGESFVNITRTNFPGAVTLAHSGAPNGVTVTFDQNPTVANQVRMLVVVAAGATVGNSTITVTASGANVANATANLALQIQQASSNQVEVQFCSASENPIFLAYQDGNGAWQRILPVVQGNIHRYTFTLTQNRGGLFFVQQSGSPTVARTLAGVRLPSRKLIAAIHPDATAARFFGRPAAASAFTYETSVFYGTVAEMTSVGLDNCATTQSTKSVSLNVAGVPAGQVANLSLGSATEIFIGGLSTSPVTFSEVRQGTVDFFGVRSAALGTPDKLLDVRGLNPADGSTLSFTADFGSANAYAPAAALLTVGNTGGDELFGFSGFTTANGEVGLLSASTDGATPGTLNWFGVPNAKLQAGDLHSNFLFASPSLSTSEMRLYLGFTTTVQNLSPVLGSRLAAPTLTTLGGVTYRRLRVQGALPAEYNDLIEGFFEPTAGGNEFLVMASGAYLAAAGFTTTYDLSIPDLTALAGFPLQSGLPGGEIETTLTAAGWTGVGILFPAPANGLVYQAASRTVKSVVP